MNSTERAKIQSIQIQKRLTISVVLVSFNQQEFIFEALEGIRNQTRTPDQVIIADDGSTDDTQKIIKQFVKTNNLESKWHLLLSTKNRGINENLNDAIKQVTSEIIVPMAGDDISLPNRCELAEILFIKNPNVCVVNSNGYIINELGDIIDKTYRPEGVNNKIEEAIRNGFPPISPVGECWRSVIFQQMGDLPTDIPNEDDQISFWGIINGGILCVNDITFKYRIHNRSASSWLRNKQSNRDFMTRFIQDMDIRRKHMSHWKVLLSIVRPNNYDNLKGLLEKKIIFYELMSNLESGNQLARIMFFLRESAALPFREKFYCMFGKLGVLSWRLMRIALKGAL